MKTLIKAFFLFFLLSISVLANEYFTNEELSYIKNKEVKVAMLPTFPPFSYLKNDKLTGYSYDILRLLSKKSGLKLKFEVDIWSKNIQKFKNKEVDIIDAISFRQNRLAFTNYTKAYYEVPLVIFARKDLNSYTGNLESLKGLKLGNTKNIFYKKQVEDLELFEIKEYDSFEEKLKALAYGEVDFIFGHLLSTQIAIEQSKYTNMKVLGDLNLANLKKTDLRFGVVKQNEILYSILKKSLSLISEKEWKELYDKWIGVYIDKQEKSSSIVSLNKQQKDFLIKNSNLNCVIAGNWPPFEIEYNNQISGMGKDYWDLIKRKTLIQSNCKAVDTFTKVLKLIENKKADLTFATAMTEDKLKFARFSKPYASYPVAIATTNDKRYISETASLSGKKVAVGKNYSAYYLLKQKYPKIEFIKVKDNYQALKLLSKGDVHAVVDILPVLSYMIGQYGFNNIKISGVTEFNFDVRVMVRKDLSELIPIINKGIDKISKKEDQEIKNKWLSVKYENIIDYTKIWQIAIISFIVILILVYRQYILNRHNKQLQEANSKIEEKTKQLAKQKELFEKIYYESSDGIFLYDINKKKIIDTNEVTLNLLAYENKEQFLNLKFDSLFPEFQADNSNSLEKISEMIRVCLLKGTNNFEMIHKKSDNSLIWLEVVTTFLTIDEKDLLHIVLRDISTRKKMEEKLNILTNKLEHRVEKEVKKNEEKTKQLIQQSRLAQMGEMISMIAHQWRQPLTAISATTNNILIKLMLGNDISKKELEDEINLISNYSQHLSLTIDDFRNFFKTDKEKMDVSLEEIVSNSISIMKSSLDSNYIKLETSFECNIKLNLYTSEVSQVILNILKNAEDALLEKEVSFPIIKVRTYIKSKYAVVKICDNAGGIPKDIIENIFDPYFSTKESKEGTGIGLYMSKIIINEHCNGDISVSNDEKGAVFKIKFSLDEKKD